MFATVSDGHGARRSVGAGRRRHRAARYPRPQRADPRHRREDAVAVRRAAQAHRRRRGGGAAHRGAARPRRQRSARAAVVEARLRLAQARDHAAAAAGNPPARHSRRRLPHREQARLSERAGGLARDRPRQYRQPGHRRHREVAGRAGAGRAAHGGARHRPAAEAGRARARSARAVRAARRTQPAREKFKAKAAAGIIVDVNTGEIVAMVSEPDYDPNNPREANDPTRINRLTTGVYEMGSTFKALTVAMALDTGKATLDSTFDARQSLRYGKFTIHDYPRREARADGAGDLHLFVEHRRRAHGAGARRRAAQGVPARRSASSTGCAPNCRKAPSRWCPSIGASSTPSPSPSATACRWRRCRR